MTRIGSVAATAGPIRPLDPTRDVRDVIHLIDEAFSGELNPVAQQTLRDLRSLGRMSWLLGPFLWTTPFSELFSGLVWTERGRVVGNVTLTRSRSAGPGSWLISNVVVAPAHREQGIGRALMEEALASIRSRGGRQVTLQVRADNVAAMHLYSDLGFRAVDSLMEMLHREPWPDPETPLELPSAVPVHARGYDDGLQEYLLAKEAIPAPAQQLSPLRRRAFEMGWADRIVRRLTNLVGSAKEYRMGIVDQGALRAILNVWAGRRLPYHRLQVMVHPQHRGKWECGLVGQGLTLLQDHPSLPVYAEAYEVDEAVVQALRQRGFALSRELVQMTLEMVGKPHSGTHR